MVDEDVVWTENEACELNVDERNGGEDRRKTTSEEERNEKKGKRGRGSGGSPDHETHIWTERERRKKMRNMFSSLHAMLPQLPQKADKSTIVDEAVSCIKSLEQTLKKLEQQKVEKKKQREQEEASTTIYNRSNLSQTTTPCTAPFPRWASPNSSSNILLTTSASPAAFQTWTSPNVILSVCGYEAQLNICSDKMKIGLFSSVCYAIGNHGLEIVSAHISSEYLTSFFMIHLRANLGTGDTQFEEAITISEIFRQAAEDIVPLVAS